MKVYPMSEPLNRALEDLFDDPSVAFGLLGIDEGSSSENSRAQPLDLRIAEGERARRLRAVLERYVLDMAAEREELGEEELPRLRAESTAMLVALRELMRHFPEAF